MCPPKYVGWQLLPARWLEHSRLPYPPLRFRGDPVYIPAHYFLPGHQGSQLQCCQVVRKGTVHQISAKLPGKSLPRELFSLLFLTANRILTVPTAPEMSPFTADSRPNTAIKETPN